MSGEKGIDVMDESRVFFKLAEGTPDERQVPWAHGRHLHEAADQIFPRLARVHEAASRQTVNHPLDTQQGLFVEALFMLWCYAAHDIKRLSDRCTALEDANLELSRATETIAEGCTHLETTTHELMESVTNVCQRLACGGEAEDPEHDYRLAEEVTSLFPNEAATEISDIVTVIGTESMKLGKVMLEQMTEDFATMSTESMVTFVGVTVARLQELHRRLAQKVASEPVVIAPSDDDGIPF